MHVRAHVGARIATGVYELRSGFYTIHRSVYVLMRVNVHTCIYMMVRLRYAGGGMDGKDGGWLLKR